MPQQVQNFEKWLTLSLQNSDDQMKTHDMYGCGQYSKRECPFFNPFDHLKINNKRLPN